MNNLNTSCSTAPVKIAFATDHAATEIRAEIIKFLENMGCIITDYGHKTSDSCDYPDYAYKACESVREGKNDKCVLICGTGIGMAIAANKVSGIRAAVVWNEDTARLASLHNNANALCLGARTATIAEICACLKVWLSTPFEQRHAGRIKKIAEIEALQCKN